MAGKAVPLKITVNSAKREIIYIEVDIEYIKKKKTDVREQQQKQQKEI